MLSLEGNDVKRGARKYLSVTDFTSDEKNEEDRGDSDGRRHREKTERPTVEDSHNWEDGEEGEEDEELCRTTCSRLEPLWEGLGSLGERLAGVNARFDQLDQEISHDRKVSTCTHSTINQCRASRLEQMVQRAFRESL